MIYFSFRCFILSLLPPLFSLPKSEDFACGRCCFDLITQIYSIYCEKDTEQSEKRYRAIARLLGIFWTTTRQILSVWLPNGRKTLLANVLSPIILLQQSVDVGKFVEYFPCNLRVGDNALVPIVLQGAGADEKPFAHFSPREIDFSPEERTVRLSNLPNTSAYFLNARNELFHFGRFFIDVLQSTPLISKSLPVRIVLNGNLLLLS